MALLSARTSNGAVGKPDGGTGPVVAVVIPSYRVNDHILNVIARIGPDVARIYAVDDCCPDRCGDFLEQHCRDDRVVILRNNRNLGVGGAVMTGYRAAIAHGADVVVKIDGDGQMDPALLSRFVAPILNGQADYTKGNRFYDLTNIRKMPSVRLIGNAILSFMTKLSSGYWSAFDPTNGYTAIHARVLAHMPLDQISKRYFFETDMLFRLNTIRAVVVDIPMDAVYGDEHSNLRVSRVLFEFLGKHLSNCLKRIFYSYFLRDMTLASLELVVGTFLLAFGLVFGSISWVRALMSGAPAPLGTIMLAALPVILGIQFLLAFLGFDIANVPKRPIHGDLPDPSPARRDPHP